jgi:hypothetical protein
LTAQIEERLEQLEEIADANRHYYLAAQQPEAVGRKSRYRAIKQMRGSWDYDSAQPFRSILAALSMEEAIRELLETSQLADVDQDLLAVENQLALLSLMALAPADERPTYLWVRGFSARGSDQPAKGVALVYRFGWHEGLGVEVADVRPPNLPHADCLLEVKGFHARPLARTEVGTHLVLPKHGGPTPVRVEVLEQWPPGEDRFEFGPIVRVHPANQPMLDVRTGLIVPSPLSPELLRAMTLGVLPRASILDMKGA